MSNKLRKFKIIIPVSSRNDMICSSTDLTLFFYQKFDWHFTVTEIAVTMPKDKVLESHQFTSELEFS